MLSNIGCILSGISWLLHLSTVYGKISKDPARKENTVYFGVYSIIVSIFMAGLFVLCVWGILALVNAMDDSDLSVILMVVFIVILAICLLTIIAEHICAGLMGVIYQFRCNRRPIGYIALVVYILATAGMIVGAVLVSGVLGID